MQPGETFLGFDFGNHLWMVMSAVTESGLVAVVSLATLRPGADRTCVLRPGDHPFVQRDSCAYYRKADLVPEQPLDRAREDGSLQLQEPLSPGILERLQQGALESRFTARMVKQAVRATLDRS